MGTYCICVLVLELLCARVDTFQTTPSLTHGDSQVWWETTLTMRYLDKRSHNKQLRARDWKMYVSR